MSDPHFDATRPQRAPSPRVLVIDDDSAVRDALESTLDEAGYRVQTAEGLRSAASFLANDSVDAVLLDIRLRNGDGLEFLQELRRSHPQLPVIMATAYGDSDRTITAMREGAFEYLTKPFDLELLLATLARAVRCAPVASVPETAQSSSFVGSSPAMLAVWKAIGRAAASTAPVLISGETGVGKELTARAIHEHSERRGGPFVAVNLAALPSTLVESELFGHEKGAFTGAQTRRIGRFEAAGGGTLFLDEIGDLDISMQTKLLRVLENGAYERVGSNEPLQATARIVAATSKSVTPGPDAVLREDLFYRLSVISIRVPALRERRSDIPLLVDAFLRRQTGTRRAVSETALSLLTSFPWPGNVRQLLHVVERACIMSASEVIDVEELQLPPQASEETDEEESLLQSGDLNLQQHLEKLERSLIVEALRRVAGNRAQAARLLGIRRQHLYTRLAALDLDTAEPRR